MAIYIFTTSTYSPAVMLCGLGLMVLGFAINAAATHVPSYGHSAIHAQLDRIEAELQNKRKGD